MDPYETGVAFPHNFWIALWGLILLYNWHPGLRNNLVAIAAITIN